MEQISRPFKGIKKSFLVVPLDWGLGHATRCIPIISSLVQDGHQVTLAGEGKIEHLLREEFSGLPFLAKSGYRIAYSTNRRLFKSSLALQIPKILRAINQEQKWLKDILDLYDFDAVISDNRYGLHHPDIYSILITHQLYIATGLGKKYSGFVQKTNQHFIGQFDECWVPDFRDEPKLAGRLSTPVFPISKLRFLGPLSSLQSHPGDENLDLAVILSGPEPQRTQFEKIILKELQDFKGTGVFVRGIPGKEKDETFVHQVKVVPHLKRSVLSEILSRAKLVICRSGYSSVMDLVQLGKKAILVPTPGQPEQEYLAEHLRSISLFSYIPQEKFSLPSAFREASEFPFKKVEQATRIFEPVIREAIQSF